MLGKAVLIAAALACVFLASPRKSSAMPVDHFASGNPSDVQNVQWGPYPWYGGWGGGWASWRRPMWRPYWGPPDWGPSVVVVAPPVMAPAIVAPPLWAPYPAPGPIGWTGWW
jgi:hypothetical protein